MAERYRYEWVLEEIRQGITLPERWPDEVSQEEVEPEYTRWWEEEQTKGGTKQDVGRSENK